MNTPIEDLHACRQAQLRRRRALLQLHVDGQAVPVIGIDDQIVGVAMGDIQGGEAGDDHRARQGDQKPGPELPVPR